MGIRMDNTSPGAFLERELQQTISRVLKKEYAEIVYPELVHVTNEVDEGAETFKYDLYDHVGDFDLISDYSADLPTSDVKRGEIVQTVRGFGGSFTYTTEELRKAMFAKLPLSEKRMEATRFSYERRCNTTCLFGRAGTGLRGFFNHPVVDKLVVNGSSNDGWFDASAITPEGMHQILMEGVNYQVNATNQVEKPDTLLVPFLVYQKIASTARSSTSDMTVLEFFLKTNGYIKEVKAINELAPANSGGALSKERMIYYKKDSSKVEFHIPMPIKFLAPQPRNLGWVVPAEAKIGGVALPYPKSVTYVDKA